MKKPKKEAAAKVEAVIGDETHRCKLCPDGGVGKRLVPVMDAVKQQALACITHAAFYGRTHTTANRKFLPGTRPAAQVPMEDPADDGPTITMMDK